MQPRKYAQAIAVGKGRIEDVPAEFRDLVCSLLEEFNAVVWCRANKISHIPTLAERRRALLGTPVEIRDAVKKKLAELWEERNLEKNYNGMVN